MPLPEFYVAHQLTPIIVAIEATKEGVKFSCQGDIGNGSVTIRQHSNVDKPDQDVSIALTEPVNLTFSLKYLSNFCKASGLSPKVKLCLSQEVPLLVEYGLTGNSFLRFYLAPKVRHAQPHENYARHIPPDFPTCTSFYYSPANCGIRRLAKTSEAFYSGASGGGKDCVEARTEERGISETHNCSGVKRVQE